LTRENAPTNGAFIKPDDLKALLEKGIILIGVFENEEQVGFVAIEKSKEEKTFYMEKLAVLPEFRHQGIGEEILDYVFDFVRSNGGEKVAIGIINENTVLKKWYERYGFKETGIKQFTHLPFTVCFMEKEV
jgi:ribosomal protein S18 acetylase RimI-like enzyme